MASPGLISLAKSSVTGTGRHGGRPLHEKKIRFAHFTNLRGTYMSQPIEVTIIGGGMITNDLLGFICTSFRSIREGVIA